MKQFFAYLLAVASLLHANTTKSQVPLIEINENGRFKGSAEVVMQQYSADLKIYGNIATTTIKMVFYNGTSRLQEGRLTLPLPEGVTISGFALDINGVMRKAVPAEKATATAVFESIERRKVDPGIIEKTEGNNFRTRIYPLPINGARTVEVVYNQKLDYDNGNLVYSLPFAKKPIKNFVLSTTVFDDISMPVLIEKPDGSYIFRKQPNAWVANINKVNFTPENPLKIALPSNYEQTKPIVKKRTEGGYYFLSAINVDKAVVPIKQISKVTIIWDNSLSGLKRDTKKEKNFLVKFFTEHPNVSVRICALATKLHCVSEFEIKNGDAAAVLKAIDGIVYDGATDYTNLNNFSDNNSDILFFTDGLSNYGELTIMPKNPVYTIVSTPIADYTKLKFISNATGGQLINLNVKNIEDTLLVFESKPYRFLGVKPNSVISEFNPGNSQILNGQLLVTGIANTLPVQITLQFGFDNAVDKEVVLEINSSNETNNWAIEKFWAQQKLDALETNFDENKNTIAQLGKQFGLVTKNTSLIVLENVNDYVKYKIVPPRDLLVEYNSIMKRQQQYHRRLGTIC